MPELVYDVKFNIDSTNLEKIADPISPAAQSSVENYKETVEQLGSAKEKTTQKGKEQKSQEDKVSKAYRDQLQHVKTLTADLREKDTAQKKAYTTGVRDVALMQRQNDEILEGTVVLEQNIQELKQLASTLNLTDKQLEQYYNALAKANAAQRTGASTAKNFDEKLRLSAGATGDMTNQAGLMNKQFSGMNQTIFSFSDLIQDSTQFQYGFATGMRAIGNNIGFTAELFAMSKKNLDDHNKAVAEGTIKGGQQMTMFDAMKQTLTGAGGLVLGINIAVTAITMLSKAFSSSSEEAKKAREAFKQYASELAQMRMVEEEDIFGLTQLEKTLEVLKEQSVIAKDVDAQVEALSDQISILSAGAVGGGATDATKDRIDALKDEREALRATTGTYKDFEKEIKATEFELAAARFALMNDELGAFSRSFSEATTSVLQFAKVNDDSDEIVQNQIESYKLMIEQLKASGGEVEDVGARIQVLESQIKRLGNSLDDSSDSVEDMDDILKDLLKTIDSLTKESQDLAITTNRYIGELTADAILQSKEYQSEQDRLYALAVGKSQEVVDAINRILTLNQQIFSMKSSQIAKDLVDSFDDSGDAIKGIEGKYDDARDALLQYNLTVESGIEGYDKLLLRLGELEKKELAVARLNIFSEEIAGVTSYYTTMAEAGENNEEQIKSLIVQYKQERENILANKNVYFDAEQMISDYNAAIAALSGLLSDTTQKAKTFFDILGERSLLVRAFGDEQDIRDYIDSLQAQLDTLLRGTDVAVQATGAIQTMGGASLESAEKIEALKSAIQMFMKMLGGDGKSGASKNVEDYSDRITKLRAEITLLDAELTKGADYANAVASVFSYISTVRALGKELQELDEDQSLARNQLKELIELRSEEFLLLSQLTVMDISDSFGLNDALTKAERLRQEIDSAIEVLLYIKTIRLQVGADTSDIDALIEKLKGVQTEQENVAKAQEIVNGLMAGRQILGAASVFAEIFGASKDFQIALATTSGLLAIVQTLADPSNPTFLGKLAASATIAASVAKQIQQIKSTEIGSAQDIEAPSAGSFGAGSSMTQVQAPTQNISFAPTAQNDGTVLNINNQVLATNKGLALITRAGEREIANSQKTVT